MENTLIIILIGIVVDTAIFGWYKWRSDRGNVTNPQTSPRQHKQNPAAIKALINGEPLPVEKIQLSQQQEKRLAPIKDAMLIARINAAFPALITVAQHASATGAKQLSNTGDLYRINIPAGSELAHVKNNPTTFRGFTRKNGKIAHQATLTKVDSTTINQTTNLTPSGDVFAAVMAVGSLIVNEYYLDEINTKLTDINNTLQEVSEFQKREFKSHILALITRTGEISQFSLEISGNRNLTQRKLQVLETLETEVTQLLQQVNLTVTDLITQNPTVNYDQYQALTSEFATLTSYQNALMALIAKIGELHYLLGQGEVSKALATAALTDYTKLTQTNAQALVNWHETQIDHLKIQLDHNRLNKSGFQGLVAKPLGLFKEDLNYKPLAPGLRATIQAQLHGDHSSAQQNLANFESNVELIARDDQYYYLPSGLDA
ncbi:hypothetical protein [Lapidilactobacillus salsurivasis]